jgi:hypothetical protein
LSGKIAAAGRTLTMGVAPGDGDEGDGTELLTCSATVTPAPRARQAGCSRAARTAVTRFRSAGSTSP